MARLRPFVFALLALFSACSRFSSSTSKTAATPAPAPADPVPAPLTLPALPDENDPRQGWIRDLVQPRLSRLSALSWSCSDNNSAIDIDLAGLGATCDEFLKANLGAFAETNTHQRPSCRGDHTLHISLESAAPNTAARKCNPGTRPPLLTQLRLPSGTGLYVQEGSALHPRFTNLPVLETAKAEPSRFHTPDKTTWLAAASYRGAVWLALEVTMPMFDPSELLAVQDFLTKAKAPRFFRPSPQLIASNISDSPSSKVPLLRISANYSEPLFRESCDYVRQWIQARQLLAPSERVNESSLFEMRCLIGWGEEPIPEDSIVLTWLPVPLLLDETFPFKTVEDALSPSLFQSLKIAR